MYNLESESRSVVPLTLEQMRDSKYKSPKQKTFCKIYNIQSALLLHPFLKGIFFLRNTNGSFFFFKDIKVTVLLDLGLLCYLIILNVISAHQRQNLSFHPLFWGRGE